MKEPHPLRKGIGGDRQDRLWSIAGPNFVAGLTEYNDEITGFAPILRGVFGKDVHYGGNAYFILNEARRRGFQVEHIEDRRG